MSLRIANRIAPLDLEYLEDPCWGHEGMARVRERCAVPLATNMCVVDLDGVAVGLRMRSVDVVLGDLFEWGGISQIRKLQGACEIFQLNLNFHSAAEFGIGTAAYLHLAAATTALPHALDTHAVELVGDIVGDGSIALTEHGTMRVPTGPGLGVELDPEKLAAAAEAYRRQGERSIYAEDAGRNGVIPVMSMQ
jgi:glucarate dehydratase